MAVKQSLHREDWSDGIVYKNIDLTARQAVTYPTFDGSTDISASVSWQSAGVCDGTSRYI